MKEHLEQADRLLAQMTVSGDNVMILAAARQALRQAYNEMKEAENVPPEHGNG